MVSIPSASSQSRRHFLGEANGLHFSKVPISSIGFMRKTAEWMESRTGKQLKTVACNAAFVKKCLACPHDVKADKQDAGFFRVRESMDARTANHVYGLYRHPRVFCKAATSGDFSVSAPGKMSQYERIIETLMTLFPVRVGVGFLAQYLIKPMLGFYIAMTLNCLLLWKLDLFWCHAVLEARHQMLLYIYISI